MSGAAARGDVMAIACSLTGARPPSFRRVLNSIRRRLAICAGRAADLMNRSPRPALPPVFEDVGRPCVSSSIAAQRCWAAISHPPSKESLPVNQFHLRRDRCFKHGGNQRCRRRSQYPARKLQRLFAKTAVNRRSLRRQRSQVRQGMHGVRRAKVGR